MLWTVTSHFFIHVTICERPTWLCTYFYSYLFWPGKMHMMKFKHQDLKNAPRDDHKFCVYHLSSKVVCNSAIPSTCVHFVVAPNWDPHHLFLRLLIFCRYLYQPDFQVFVSSDFLKYCYCFLCALYVLLIQNQLKVSLLFSSPLLTFWSLF
jgi:hypothetical protein